MTLTRREFLKLIGAVTGALACRVFGTSPDIPVTLEKQAVAVRPSATPTVPSAPTVTATPTSVAPPPAATTTATATASAVATETPSPTVATATAESTPTLPVSRPPFVVDAHQDIAWNYLEFGRDPREDVYTARAREAGTSVPPVMGQRTSGLPQWLQGRIGIIFATLFIMPLRYAYTGWTKQTYVSADDAHAKANQQLGFYKQLATQEPRLQLITTSQELENIITLWANPIDLPETRVGMVLLMEGADAIREPAELPDWYAQGLRIVGPAWVSTRYAGGTGEPGPLTDLGHQLLGTMAEVGMILDLSHLAEEAYLEAVDSYPGVVIASHSNPRRFLPTDRGLSDTMIGRLANRDGVMGIMPYNRYLKPGWTVGDSRLEVTIQTVVEAIDHVAQLTGSAAHVAIGSDFDGGFGLESIPAEMDSIADLLQIGEGLSAWGYRPEEIEMIMNGNWVRILRSALGTGQN